MSIKSNASALQRLSARLRPLTVALPVVGALLAGTGVASATTYSYSAVTVTNEENIHILTPNNIAGGMGMITLIGSGSDLNNNLNVWCVDVYQYLQLHDTFNEGTLTTSGSGTPNPSLTATQIKQIGGLIANALIPANFSNVHFSAATQLAIWEVEYGIPPAVPVPNGFTFTGVNPLTAALATTLIAQLGVTIPYQPVVTLLITTHNPDNNQQLVFALAPTGFLPTPLPATLPMLAGGLAGFGYLARRGKKRKAA